MGKYKTNAQGCCGIKGTTFILEDDGKTSSVKVFEDEAEFTPYGEENTSILITAKSNKRSMPIVAIIITFAVIIVCDVLIFILIRKKDCHCKYII